MTTATTTQTPASTADSVATIHLARLPLNPRSRDVHQDLRDHTALHQRVSALYPDILGTTPRAAHNILYRLERERTGATLLIQSTNITINRNALPSNYTAPGVDVEYREIGPLLDWAALGRTVRYRIDANPTKSQPSPKDGPGKRPRGRRIPLTGEDAVTWWERQAERAGLTLNLSLDSPQPPVLATRGTNRRARLTVTRFDGIATITNPNNLRHAITTGIGQGRAYGLGLLSIAPHHEQ
ncbi:type I-E CRISPR-associated protein Cas6/Cse3/CasE [Streptomyces sp. NPDC048506]|uniref:type I-E CRISPR-associated protein Cas6/Cse3/CasE n=1 Tax=Streptomyces sp. NPDC048506 TaxID=3155028 RepID=UPI003438677A